MKKINYIYRELQKTFGIQEREFISFLRKYFGKKKIIGCEIGVHKGDNAYSILHYLNIEMLYLIDINIDKIRSQVCNNCRTVLLRGKSQDVSHRIPNNLDFVYVDGSHNYSDCVRDLILYYSKTKIIGGHDFSPKYISVVNAVMDFSNKYNFKLEGNLDKEWWIKIK